MIELKVILDPNDTEAARKRTAHRLKVIANAHFTSDDAPVSLGVRVQEVRPDLGDRKVEIVSQSAPAAPITEIPEAPIEHAGDFTPAQVGNVATDATLTPATEVDKAGLPWDRRIHSDATERLTKEGFWKRRRNIDDATVAPVEAELRALMAIPAQAVPDVPTPPPGTVALDNGGTADMETGEYAAPTPPPAPAPAAPVAKAVDFAGFMRLLTPKIQAKELTHVQVNEALAALDLKSVPQLAQRSDLIPSVVALLGL